MTCGGENLSGDELRRHLDTCPTCRERARAAAVDADRTRTGAPGPLPAKETHEPLKRGSLVGRYVVLDVLGAGGQGEVYSAIDPELDRKVAIKLVKDSGQGSSSGSTSEGQTRLLREAQAMAKLSHPNVVPVFDVGLVEGRVFLAMEYVQGTTVKAWLKEKPRPWRDVLRVMLDAGKGLAAAHGQGMVHRDFKPENVLIGSDGRVRVLDFGLARASGPAQPDPSVPDELTSGARHLLASPLTQVGHVAGTPAYMAPEQLRGQDLDARTDQFSFCVALYEALYGERPFSGDNYAERVAAVLAGTVRQAPKASRVPTWLRRVVLRGLSVAPESRFPSLEALLDAASRDPALARRRWLSAAAVALVLGGTLEGAVLWSRHQSQQCTGAEEKLREVWDEDRKESIHQAFLRTGAPYAEAVWKTMRAELDAYASAWVAQHTQACEATRLRGEQPEEVLGLRMQCLVDRREELKALSDALTRASAKTVEQASDTAKGLTQLDLCADVALLQRRIPLPKNQAVLKEVESLKKGLAEIRALRITGAYQQGLELLTSTLARARTSQYPPVLAEALLLQSQFSYFEDRLDAARAAALEAIGFAEASGDDLIRYRALVNLVQTGAGLNVNAEEYLAYARLADLLLMRFKDRAQHEALLRNAVGLLHYYAGRFDLAKVEFERGLPLAEADGEVDTMFRTNLANLLITRELLPAAVEQHELVLKLEEQRMGAEHPFVAMDHFNLGCDHLELDQYAAALSYFERAYAIRLKLYGTEHVRTASTLAYLGETHRKLGKAALSEEELRRAIATLEAIGQGGTEFSEALIFYGEVLVDRGRPAESLQQFTRALELRKDSAERLWARPLLGVGRAHLQLGRLVEAQHPLEEAVRLYAADTFANIADLSLARVSLAELQWRQGKHRAASQLVQGTLDALTKSRGDVSLHIDRAKQWLESHPER